MKAKLFGIFREPVFSPNAVDADRAILEDTLRFLESKYSDVLEVRRLDPANMDMIELEAELKKAQYILSMAQGKDVIALLEKLEHKGVKVWNPVFSIKACFRKTMSELLSSKDVGYPKYVMINTEQNFDISTLDITKSYWIKRGDFHAVTPEDVSFAKTVNDVKRIIAEFAERGVEKAIIQEHAEGQIVKFYGVRNGFFDYRIMSTHGFNEKIQINLKRIRNVAIEAAEAMKLEVYGGDCVVSRDGSLHIIDMNDWPSFRTCRKEASQAIGYHVVKKLLGLIVEPPASLITLKEDVVQVSDNNIDKNMVSSGVIQ